MTSKKIGVCCTDGQGLWSNTASKVIITAIDLISANGDTIADSTSGELWVSFDIETWDTEVDGLIYTDKLWLFEFKSLLKKSGFSARAVEDIEYSEAGMQGADYVSLDVGDSFIIECDPFYNFVEGQKPKKIAIGITAFG